jgi:hypothetical protein
MQATRGDGNEPKRNDKRPIIIHTRREINIFVDELSVRVGESEREVHA